MNLTKLSLLSLAVAAMMIIGQSEASAQNTGYQFGIGYGYANGLNYGPSLHRGRGIGLLNSGFNQAVQNEIPHFAMYPPVYYSGEIVRRPYGVSPYAAPPGIMPVEMTLPAEPTIITNPYFREEKIVPEQELDKKPADADDKDDGKKGVETSTGTNTVDNKTKHLNVVIRNPFFVPTSDVSSLAKVTE